MGDNETLGGVVTSTSVQTVVDFEVNGTFTDSSRLLGKLDTGGNGVWSGTDTIADWLLAKLSADNGTSDALTNWTLNATGGFDDLPDENPPKQYWALLLVIFPLFTVFGNVLVILSVYKEKRLHNVTNYFIVSLAFADLLVAALVMPFAVYVLVNIKWEMSPTVCDFYIAMDVICSTSSILNLVAISIDRYYAVIHPIKYIKPTNYNRAFTTIAVVWVISAAIGSPIVLGLNTAPDKDPTMCIFYNADFIIYSSLSSFFIPCIMMVYLYFRIFWALRMRLKAVTAKQTQRIAELQGTVIENRAQTQRLQETAIGPSGNPENQTMDLVGDLPTDNPTESGSHEDEELLGDEERQQTPASEDCRVIPNDKSTEFMLTPVREDAHHQSKTSDRLSGNPNTNGNNDSGYAPSTMDETPSAPKSLPSQQPQETPLFVLVEVSSTGNGQNAPKSPSHPPSQPPSPPRSSSGSNTARRNGEAITPLATDPGADVGHREGVGSSSGHLHPTGRRTTSGIRLSKFTSKQIRKRSGRKKENAAAKKERKATQTLAIVVVVFLICWVPFFTTNVMDALCTKLHQPSCRPSITTFLLTTWLGYVNSFINPVIYTIFSLDFRRAFKKILTLA